MDLFAGCGGLGLGLERAGFETVFVNELHQDAMDTYLLNRPLGDLKAKQNHANDILEVTKTPGELEALAQRLRREHGDIDLVAGGPPCQGYSGIGHRRSFVLAKEEIPSNHLYRDMAKFVQAVQPKAFLFENVRGLLNARWIPTGEKGEIWEEVRQTFKDITIKRGRKILHYEIGWALVSAKDYGVPQNRPRVLMIGFRSDIAPAKRTGLVADGYLPQPDDQGAPDPIDLLGDLDDPHWIRGGSTSRYLVDPKNEVQELLRTTTDGKLLSKGDPLTEQEYGNHADRIVAKFQYMLDNDGQIPVEMQTKKFAQRVIPERWGPGGANITATSLADDYVHFSRPRVPTVREWARIQMFPDWYQFAGKRTTGGRRRAGDPSTGDWTREVPKYTQIGNAVPVALAERVGQHLNSLLGD
ncbi:DNA cytosine methyltransferase [Pedococcus sp. P5_B7]